MIDIEVDEKLIDQGEMNQIEIDLSVKFPEDYRNYMLIYNGGSPKSISVYFNKKNIRLSSFLPLKYGEDTLEESYMNSRDFLPKNYVPIGYTETGNLCMSLSKDTYGSVYVYYSDVELELLASSFTEFLDGLVDYTGEID